MTLARRSTVTSTSARRRENPRTYPSTSTESLPNPERGRARATWSSVNRPGSRGDEPYTAALLLTTRRRTPGARWQAASSCIVPMTLISFIDARPPADSGVAMTLRCATVSTSAWEITLAMIGLRMSARTKSTPRSGRCGGTTSTATTRSTPGVVATSSAKRPPRYREAPVTSTTCPTRTTAVPFASSGDPSPSVGGRVPGTDDVPRAEIASARRAEAQPTAPDREGRGPSGRLLLVATLVTRLAQQLAVLLLRHPLAALLDDRAHVYLVVRMSS